MKKCTWGVKKISVTSLKTRTQTWRFTLMQKGDKWYDFGSRMSCDDFLTKMTKLKHSKQTILIVFLP